MPRNVLMPDGSVLQGVPDQLSATDKVKFQRLVQESQARAAQKKQQQQPQEPPSRAMQALDETARVGATAGYDGVMALPKLAWQGINQLGDLSTEMFSGPKAVERNQQLRGEVGKKIDRFEQSFRPRTNAGKRAANIGAMGAGSLIGVPAANVAPAAALAAGLTAGTTGEIAGALTNPTQDPDQDNPLIKLGASVGGGLMGAGGHMLWDRVITGNAGKRAAARAALEGQTDSQVAHSISAMKGAEKENFPLLYPQTLSQKSNADALLGVTGESAGMKARDALRRQDQALRVRGYEVVDQMPGVEQPKQVLANRTREAANSFLKSFKEKAAATQDNVLASMDTIPQEAMQKLSQDLDVFAMQFPENTMAQRLVRRLQKRIQVAAPEAEGGAEAAMRPKYSSPLIGQKPAAQAAEELTEATPQFLDNPVQIRELLNDELNKFGANTLSSKPAQANSNMLASKLRTLFKDTVLNEEYAPELTKQRNDYGLLMDHRDQLARGPLGDFAARGATDAPAPHSKSAENLFRSPKYAPEGGGNVVGTVAEQLTAGSPDENLIADAGHTWLRGVIDRAKTSLTARPNEDFAQNIVQELGNPLRANARWKQTEQGLTAIGQTSGLSPEDTNNLIQGVRKLSVLAARSAVRGPQSAMDFAQMKKMASPDMLKRMGAASFIAPLRQPFLAAQRSLENRLIATIDQWITTPEGVAAMQKFAKAHDPHSMRAALMPLLQSTSRVTGASGHTKTTR